MNKNILKDQVETRSLQSGAAMLLFVLFFTMAIVAVVTTMNRTYLSDILSSLRTVALLKTEAAADAGVEDMTYRFIAGLTPDAQESIEINGIPVVTEFSNNSVTGGIDIIATSTSARSVRSTRMSLQVGLGASFNFGVQSGTGGFEMSNGSSVQGNVFSNGKVEKVGGGTATIYGDAISAGPTGLILDINVDNDARARVIEDSTVGGDAFAHTLDGGLVSGDAYCDNLEGGASTGSNGCLPYVPEEDPVDLPIDDTTVEALKQDVVDNATEIITSADPRCAGGEYFLDTDITLGFVKIECDFRFKKQGPSTTLTLTGPLWIEGDLIFEAGPTIEIDSGADNKLMQIVVDNPADRITSSRISVENGTTFTGNGGDKSYILLLSQNEDAETGGTSEDAIFIGQSSAGDLLLYAGHGRIALGNSVSLKEVTGYLIQLNNSAEVIYESGLANSSFTTGPGGGYNVIGWQDVD